MGVTKRVTDSPSSAALAVPADGQFRGPLLVDGHVHFHDCYQRNAFLDGALENFRTAAAALTLQPELAGCLLFSESAGADFFKQIRSEAGQPGSGSWRFQRTREDAALIAHRDGGGFLLLLAGRQIVTGEGLEVLALACAQDFPDGFGLQTTLDAVLDSGAIAVLPWGFGKWLFGRGRLMAEAIGSLDPNGVYLGDNSGRLGALPEPRLFAPGRAKGMWVLPGTDPFPFPSEARKAGSHGFVLDGPISAERPAAALRERLGRLEGQPSGFGRLEGPLRFIRNQVKMQLRKRL